MGLVQNITLIDPHNLDETKGVELHSRHCKNTKGFLNGDKELYD